MEDNITLEDLQVMYAEKCKECETLKASNSKLQEDNELMQRDYNDLQRANNKLFMMIDNPAPKVDEPKDEPTPEEKQAKMESDLLNAIKGGLK